MFLSFDVKFIPVGSHMNILLELLILLWTSWDLVENLGVDLLKDLLDVAASLAGKVVDFALVLLVQSR